MSEIIPIVNDRDEVIGSAAREVFDYACDIYRVSALMVINGRGQVLLAQRSLKKPNAPGVWGPSVAGTVAMGESYIDTMVREAEEEIGLSGVEFEILHKSLIRSKRSFFCQFFRAIVDRLEGEFIIQTDEVEQIRWMDRDEVIADATAHPEKYTSQFAAELRNITP